MGRFFIMGHGEEQIQEPQPVASIAPIEPVAPLSVEEAPLPPPALEERIVYVDKPVLVEKEVETLVYVARPVEVIVEKERIVEVEVIKEVLVDRPVPYEVIKYIISEPVEKEVIVDRVVFKISPLVLGTIAIETLMLIVLLLK